VEYSCVIGSWGGHGGATACIQEYLAAQRRPRGAGRRGPRARRLPRHAGGIPARLDRAARCVGDGRSIGAVVCGRRGCVGTRTRRALCETISYEYQLTSKAIQSLATLALQLMETEVNDHWHELMVAGAEESLLTLQLRRLMVRASPCPDP